MLVASELAAVLGLWPDTALAVRHNKIEALMLELLAMLIAIVGAVCDQLETPGAADFEVVDSVFEQRDFGRTGARKPT